MAEFLLLRNKSALLSGASKFFQISRLLNLHIYVGRLSYFSGGTLKIELDGKTGFVNSLGYLVIQCLYNYASNFYKGLSEISDASGNKLGYINKSGVEYWKD